MVKQDKSKAVAMRTCVGSRQQFPEEELLRCVLLPGVDGAAAQLAIDWSGKAPGRGAYVSADPKHIHQALTRGGFQRAFKASLKVPSPEAFIEDACRGLGQAFGQRLSLARRAGVVVSGEARVSACLKQERGLVLILASNLSQGNRRKYGLNAQRKGMAVVSPLSGEALGQRIGRSFAGLILVEAEPFARDLERMGRQLAALQGEGEGRL